MRTILKSTVALLSLFASVPLLLAQEGREEYGDITYKTQGGVATGKKVSDQNEDGTFTITLETFAQGSSAFVQSSVPSDIILILDISSSMTADYQGTTRIRALQNSVRDFVISIYENAVTARQSDPSYAGNRVAIVAYNRNAKMVTTGGWVDVESGVITKSGDTYGGSLINTITATSTPNGNTALSTGTGTRPDHGMDMAIDQLLDGSPATARPNANLTVVLFTDGYPTDNNAFHELGIRSDQGSTDKFEWPIANKALYYASQIKKTYGAKFYSIGLISALGNNAQNWQRDNYARVLQMMDWLSSNYPDAAFTSVDTNNLYVENAGSNGNHYNGYSTANTNWAYGVNQIVEPWRNAWNISGGSVSLSGFTAGSRASGDDVPEDGYSFIVDDNTSFDSVFEGIANASGGSAAEVGTSTEIRDVITSSFELPEGTTPSAIRYYTMDIAADGDSWVNKQTPTGVSVELGKKSYIENGKEVVRDTVGVTGFDFSLADTPNDEGEDQVGDGNWVGLRYRANGTSFFAGKKLVIEFEVDEVEGITGGDGTATNTAESGVYVLIDGVYTLVNSYDVPHTDLPVNIRIRKSGLRHGESATFEIQRCAPLIVDGEVQYNALGKPKPDPNWVDPDDNPDNEKGFHTWSKVILTNKGVNGASVEKTLLSLDPWYVYKIVEDDWGWGYTLSHTGGDFTTSDVEINPFDFENVEKTDAVKHAEAVTINHFKTGEGEESYVEAYQSSKVKNY